MSEIKKLGDMQPMTEENMAEGGWVRGPLDADGKMWRSGDMSDSNWGMIEGIAYEDGRWLVSGHDTSAPWIPADSIRHYHEPTVEERLSDEEVVRCRDCACFSVDDSDHDYRTGWWCKRWYTDMVMPDGFCAWGKRRESE